MKRLLFHLTFFLWIVSIALPAASGAGEPIQVLSPPDLTFVKGKHINLVYRVEKDFFDGMRVTVDNDRVRSVNEHVVAYDIYHDSISLSGGINRIKIEGLRSGKAIAEKVVTVFRRSAISMHNYSPPSGFSQYTFHLPQNEETCGSSPCHGGEIGSSSGDQSKQGVENSPCYRCHKRILNYNYIHGPASVWECLTCHKENSEKAKYAVPEPMAVACQMCHTTEFEKWHSEKFGHGPTMAGKCVLCHNPHASNEEFFLIREASDLCWSCHESKLKGKHVIAGFLGKGHPLKKNSKLNGGMKLSCVSCHNPHAANNINLLVGFNGSRAAFCRNCHAH